MLELVLDGWGLGRQYPLDKDFLVTLLIWSHEGLVLVAKRACGNPMEGGARKGVTHRVEVIQNAHELLPPSMR